MKNSISTVMLVTAALCGGLHPASANLLGMPLNLQVALERSDVRVLTPAYQSYNRRCVIGSTPGHGLLTTHALQLEERRSGFAALTAVERAASPGFSSL